MLAAIALLSLAATRADDAAQARGLLEAWRATPGAAAVSTRVSVREGEREGTAVCEPCVIAWEAAVPRVALRRGALTVVVDAGRLQAAHAEGDAAVDRAAPEAAREWLACFAEMPWPQPEMVLLPADAALARLDPEMGDLQVAAVQVDEASRSTVRLKGPRGSWALVFEGSAPPRLVSAERVVDAGPRVPKGGSITWSMRFEPIEPESGLWKPPIDGRRRVDRVEDVMPRPREAGSGAAPSAPAVEPTPRTDSIPPKP